MGNLLVFLRYYGCASGRISTFLYKVNYSCTDINRNQCIHPLVKLQNDKYRECNNDKIKNKHRTSHTPARIFINQSGNNVDPAGSSAIAKNNTKTDSNKYACKQCYQCHIFLQPHIELVGLKNR